MKNLILRNTTFKVDPNGHGGNRRTAQIAELVQSAGYEIADVGCWANSPSGRLANYVNGVRFWVQNPLEILPLPRLINLCGHQSQIFQQAIDRHPGRKLLLWEATRSSIGLQVAKNSHFKVVAVPHNLESLLANQKDIFTRRSLPGSLQDELKRLAKADAVFCISREEQWLLRLFGIKSDYLPYYPPQTALANLMQVRQWREQQLSEPHKFLILGTASNTPTRLGMIEQILLLKKLRREVDFEVDIVGYGTEKLEDYCDSDAFTLQGSVDSEKLHYLLKNAKAILLYQTKGSGALTRIPEMLIAGIPIIANSHACRSAFSYPGVYCYDHELELMDLMSKELDLPKLLPPPVKAAKRFINCIKRLIE